MVEELLYIGFTQEKDGMLRIHLVVTTEEGYDVNWSRHFQTYLYHASGDTSMWDSPYWSRDPIDPPPEYWKYLSSQPVRLSAIPEQFLQDSSFMTWFIQQCIDSGRIFYCSRCKDYYPSDEHCSHIWYCDACGTYSIPGERCRHKRAD